MDLYKKSIEKILANQADSGAYIASPNFPSYAYSWIRDGSFIAFSMDVAGEHLSARSFHQWVHKTVMKHGEKVESALEKMKVGEGVNENDFLHTRFTLEGEESEAEWKNFQLDGYGTWLWALSQHITLAQGRSSVVEYQESITLILSYLSAIWKHPNYDCWEEFQEFLHPSTLAAIYAGLVAGAELINDPIREIAQRAALDIKDFVIKEGSVNGFVCKAISLTPQLEPPEGVDAGLIGVFHPYQLVDHSEPLAETTIAKIEADLHRENGGVYRYLKDTYFGGGEWILLAGWLGWYYAEIGEHGMASGLLTWIEAQVDREGNLPEQVSEHLLAPRCYQEWEDRWGPVANPLLWSHAMYIILRNALENRNDE